MRSGERAYLIGSPMIGNKRVSPLRVTDTGFLAFSTCIIRALGRGSYLARLSKTALNTGTAVLLVGDGLHPVDVIAVDHLRNGQVEHRGRQRCAVPMALLTRAPHDVAGADLGARASFRIASSQRR
jgi:hypothetical protein